MKHDIRLNMHPIRVRKYSKKQIIRMFVYSENNCKTEKVKLSIFHSYIIMWPESFPPCSVKT